MNGLYLGRNVLCDEFFALRVDFAEQTCVCLQVRSGWEHGGSSQQVAWSSSCSVSVNAGLGSAPPARLISVCTCSPFYRLGCVWRDVLGPSTFSIFLGFRT